VQRILLRRQDQVAGWYVYALHRDGIAEVLQIGCREADAAQVVDHLFQHARHNGASALAGRIEPHLTKAISAQTCIFSRRDHSMLIHSRDVNILNAIHSGKAFISRLDGEWCLRFH
jgi:hypothetical protein